VLRVANAKRLGHVPVGPPWMIIITRVGKRAMDSDNLHGACKSIRDGIADALGIDDGSDNEAVWICKQEVGKQYLVKIEIRTLDVKT
jgi:hypothetical protein